MTELSGQDWLAIEQLNDMVFSDGDSGSSVASALAIIQQQLGSSSIAVYLPGHSRQITWESSAAPAAWRQACLDETSQLNGLVRRCMSQAVAMPGIEALQLKAVLPLSGPAGVMGVVLVSVFAVEDAPRWQAYLRALARIITVQQKRHPQQSGPKETEVLRVLAEAQNTITDPDKMAFQMTDGIRRIFGAEDAILVLFDGENPDLAICKRLGYRVRGEWLSQYSVRLGRRIVEWMVSDYHVLTTDDIYAEPELEGLFRNERDLQVEVISCSPVKINNGQIIGTLILVNQPSISLNSEQPVLLATAAKGLANLIHTSRVIMLLKISNADLEALRWELTNSRSTLRTLFDSLPTSIYIVDHVYNLVAINASRSTRVNQHPSALVGRKCYEVLYGRQEPCKGCMVAETLHNGHHMQWMNREWGNDDIYKEWDVRTFPVHDAPEKPCRAIVVEEDITAQRAMESSLAQFEKMALVGQLATGMAQDLQNPLTAILANAQMLKHFIPREQFELHDSLNLIESAGRSIHQNALNLLGIAQKGRYEFLPCDLNDTLTHAYSLVQYEIKNRQVKVRMALEENMPSIAVSKDHLQEVWINLMLVEMESLDKEDRWIEICSYYENGWYHLTFQDNGRGIPQEQLEKLFEPAANGRRSGLNLYNCKKVIHQHGGSIEADSRPGQWTRFSITLPAQNATIVVKERGRVKEYELSGIR